MAVWANLQWALVGLAGFQMTCAALYFTGFHLRKVISGAEASVENEAGARTVRVLSLVVYGSILAALVLGPGAMALSVLKLGLI
ncbi:MAG: hypothetical protein K0U74_03730 [Alphaproteobacteria bacterium]|nr:hypothetical protein [Alphaproteobacteria bacterium]